MSGRRLLDAAALLRASQAIASNHIKLRVHEIDTYSKTSSLARAIGVQTSQSSANAQASTVRCRPSKSSGPQYSTLTRDEDNSITERSLPTTKNVTGAEISAVQVEGLEQDHFYQRSNQNTTTQPVSDGELHLNQDTAEASPLLDGTIPPAGAALLDSVTGKEVFSETQRSSPLKNPVADEKPAELKPQVSGRSSIPNPDNLTMPPSADEARESQSRAERQIPSQPTETRPKGTSTQQTTYSGSPELGIQQDRDVYYTPSSLTSPVLSSLPQIKVPKNTEETQGGDDRISIREINQDVFYGSKFDHSSSTPACDRSITPEDSISAEVYSEIFQSPRVAKLLSTRGREDRDFRNLQIQDRETTASKQSNPAKNADRRNSNNRRRDNKDSESPRQVEDTKNGVRQLAADIAEDAQDTSKTGVEVSTNRSFDPVQMLID